MKKISFLSLLLILLTILIYSCQKDITVPKPDIVDGVKLLYYKPTGNEKTVPMDDSKPLYEGTVNNSPGLEARIKAFDAATQIQGLQVRDGAPIYATAQIISNVRNWLNYTYSNAGFTQTDTYSYCDSLMIPVQTGGFSANAAAYMKDLAKYYIGQRYGSLPVTNSTNKALLYAEIRDGGAVGSNRKFWLYHTYGTIQGIPGPYVFDQEHYADNGGNEFPSPRWATDYIDQYYNGSVCFHVEKALNYKFGTVNPTPDKYIDSIVVIGFQDFDNTNSRIDIQASPGINPNAFDDCGWDVKRMKFPSAFVTSAYDLTRQSFTNDHGNPLRLYGLRAYIGKSPYATVGYYNFGLQYFSQIKPNLFSFLNCELFNADTEYGGNNFNSISESSDWDIAMHANNNVLFNCLPVSTYGENVAKILAPAANIMPFVEIYPDGKYDITHGPQRNMYYAVYGRVQLRGGPATNIGAFQQPNPNNYF